MAGEKKGLTCKAKADTNLFERAEEGPPILRVVPRGESLNVPDPNAVTNVKSSSVNASQWQYLAVVDSKGVEGYVDVKHVTKPE